MAYNRFYFRAIAPRNVPARHSGFLLQAFVFLFIRGFSEIFLCSQVCDDACKPNDVARKRFLGKSSRIDAWMNTPVVHFTAHIIYFFWQYISFDSG